MHSCRVADVRRVHPIVIIAASAIAPHEGLRAVVFVHQPRECSARAYACANHVVDDLGCVAEEKLATRATI